MIGWAFAKGAWAIITGTPIARMLAKIGGVIFAVLTMRALWKRDGAKEQRADAQQKDIKNAQDIRERVATGRTERVQSVKDRGYRD